MYPYVCISSGRVVGARLGRQPVGRTCPRRKALHGGAAANYDLPDALALSLCGASLQVGVCCVHFPGLVTTVAEQLIKGEDKGQRMYVCTTRQFRTAAAQPMRAVRTARAHTANCAWFGPAIVCGVGRIWAYVKPDVARALPTAILVAQGLPPV